MALKWTSRDPQTGENLIDAVAMARGEALAQSHHVINMILDPSGSMVTGVVLGSSAQRYNCIAKLAYQPDADSWAVSVGICSCPVARNCKHVAALVFAAAQEPKVEATLGRTALTIRGERGLGEVPSKDDGAAVEPSQRTPPATGGWLLHPESNPFEEESAPSWERGLEALLGVQRQRQQPRDTPSSARSVERQPGRLGLSFRPASPQAESARPREGASLEPIGVEVRPVYAPNGRDWQSAALNWNVIASASATDSYRLTPNIDRNDVVPAQLDWLMDFLTDARVDSATTPGHSRQWLNLRNYHGRDLVEKLALAADLNIELIGTADVTAVTARSTPVRVVLDTSRVTQGVRVSAAVERDDGKVWPENQITLLGRPAHSVLRTVRTSVQGSGGSREKHELALEFHPLNKPVSRAMQDFIDAGSVTVPEADEARFFTQYLPQLRSIAPVGSSNLSVDLPEVSEPELSLLVTYLPGHVLRLHWEWHYRAGKQLSIHPLISEPTDEPYRDGVKERTIIERALPALDPMPMLTEPDLGTLRRRPVAIRQLEGFNAVTFVEEVLPTLRDVPGLELEEDGAPPDFKEIDEAPVISVGTEETPEQDWFDLRIIITIKGEKVPFEKIFSDLVKGYTRMLLPSGAHFSLENEELLRLRDLIQEARGIQDTKDGSLRLSKYHISLWEELAARGVVGEQAQRWKETLETMHSLSVKEPEEPPATVTATLRPYQKQGFNWLLFLARNGLGGILADDMGLGKTLQTLAMFAALKQADNVTHAPHLVVAPTSVVGNWINEAKKFTPALKVAAVTETHARSGRSLLELLDADVIVTSYAIFRLDYEQFEPVEFATVVFDEAQFVKNRDSKAYKCAKLVRAKSKFAITGTPLENNLMDLWSLLSIAAPGLYPNPSSFAESIRKPIEKYADAKALDRLRRRVRPLILRRTKEVVAQELPRKTEQVLEVELNAKHAKAYQTRLQRERQKILGLLKDMRKNQFSIFQSLTTLRLLSLDVSLADPEVTNVSSSKLDVLLDQLDDVLAEGHRALVFSQFTSFLDLLRVRLDAANVPYSYLDGRTRKRQAVVDGFKNGTDPLFLISLKAGGFGINLTEADYCFILDPWWNPATEAQAVDRTHRIGQTKPVMVYRLVAKGTIEEKVMALKAKKSRLFSDVMETGNVSSSVLTEEDLRSLLE